MYSGQTITDGSVVWKVKDLRDVATTVEAGLMSAADKIKLNGIATGANAYSLPNASTSTKGGLIVGAGLAANGATVSVAAASTGTIGGVKIGTGISTGAGGVISIPSATSVSAGLMTTDQVTKLNGIATNANNYTLPTASTSTKGGIIVGSGLVANGATVSVGAASTGTIGGIKLGSSGFLRYDGTWATPTNTTYNVATSSANGLMSASDKSKLDGITAALQYKGTVESYSKLPTTGLVTGYVYNITNAGGTDANGVAIKAGDNVAYNGSGWDVLSGTVDLSNYVTKDGSKVLSTNDFTTAYKNKLDNIANNANNYSLPNASTTTKGGLIVGAGLAANGATVSVAAASTGTLGGVKLGGGTANFYRADGNWAAPPNTTYPAMTGARSSAAGAAGLVPAPAAGKQTSFLRGDGTWVIPTNTTYSVFASGTATINGTLVPSIAANTSGKYLQSNGTWATPTNTTYPAASGSTAGLMSAAHYTKLEGIASGANAYALPTASASTKGGIKVGAGLAMSSETLTLAAASAGTIGGVKIGSGISTGAGGVISIPSATSVSAGLMTTDQVTKLNGIATGANAYSLPNASTTTKGGIIVGSGLVANGATVSVGAASTSKIGGITLGGGTTNFFRADGQWAAPPGVTQLASSSANGLMSKDDKVLLSTIYDDVLGVGTLSSSSYVSYNYDAKSHSPVSLLTSSQYSWLEKVDSVSSGSTTTATNAGTYNIMYKPKDGYHWRGLTGTASVAAQAYKWTINRIADTITLSSGTDAVILVGSGDKKTVTVSSGSTGAISVNPSSNSYFTSSISGKVITFTFASAPSDGTMSSTNVTITSAAGGNYNASTKTLQVKTTVVQSNLIDNINALSAVKTAVANGVAPNTWAPGDIIGPVTMNGTLSGSNDCVLNNYKAYFFVLGFDHNYQKESKVTENNVDYYYHTMTLQFGVYTKSDGSYDANYHVAFCDSKYGQRSFSDANYFRHHTTNTNAQGWAGTSTQALYTETPSAQGSDLRKISCPRFYKALPETWRNAICEITKYTDNTGGGSDTASYVTASTEVIFLLSEYEVFGARSYANSAEQNYQKQYNYFTYGGKAVRDTAKMWKYNDISTWLFPCVGAPTDGFFWWFRSSDLGDSSSFSHGVAYNSVQPWYGYAYWAYGFAPAFCIGDKSIRYTAANFVANQYSGIHS